MVDFGRFNHIKHVIELDFDPHTYEEVESKAKCVTRYLGTMKAILDLPVAAWDCPTTASGEIDTERKTKMSWNNGQNNGNGGGYGGGADDVYGRLNNTKELGGARFPFLEDTGRVVLCTLEEFTHSSDGPSARALFEVLESRNGKNAAGSYAVKIWKLVKPPFKPGMTTGADEFADFCRKLKGAPAGYPIGNDIRVLMKERPADQLARGTVIDAVAVPNQKGTWINIFWNSVQQSPQDIAAQRARLEQKGIPSTGPAPTQMPQQYPAPQQYAQPVQTQGQYAQPAPMPQQGVPQGGFLANVPPQGNNGGNGNGSSGSW